MFTNKTSAQYTKQTRRLFHINDQNTYVNVLNEVASDSKSLKDKLRWVPYSVASSQFTGYQKHKQTSLQLLLIDIRYIFIYFVSLKA
jgi:hypothetical protein